MAAPCTLLPRRPSRSAATDHTPPRPGGPLLVLALAIGAATPAHAVDACKLLLCLAGNWGAIPMCVPTVTTALRQMALGHPFPTCDMTDDNNAGHNQWTTEATCPPFYRQYEAYNNTYIGCTYNGLIDVRVDGKPWLDVFWNTFGQTSIRYHDAARAQLGADIDPTYDNDEAAWNAKQPTPSDPPPSS